ncbi:hypothetical protein A4A49_18433 [Nicotiana attenuata]|uniref:Uncharacterized protein n=1 Tax=Nicotiana attenuata TaxID=49451 RepID=A0A314KJ39_NICAT|nr:hypothetical protein A4A49_18433 [Nicotiana attenuata]
MGLKDLEVQLIERTKGGGPSKTPRDTKGATGASGFGTDGATSAKHAAVAVVEHHENARQEPAAFGSKLEAAVGNDKEVMKDRSQDLREMINEITVRQEEQTFDRMLPRIKTWADQVEYEAEEQQVNTLAAIFVHDRHEAAPTPGQKQLIENNSGTNQFNTASSKAATRKENKKVQQVQDTTLKMHHEQDNTSANVLSSSPNTHVFVPSGQKQNVSAALISQQLLKDDKKELSPATHQITKIPAGMKEIELSAGREKQQISGVTLISNTTMLQFSSTRVENVIKDTHLMTKHENKSTGKLKSKLDAPDFIPRKPPGGTCIHNVVTSQNDGQEHIGTSKEGQHQQ